MTFIVLFIKIASLFDIYFQTVLGKISTTLNESQQSCDSELILNSLRLNEVRLFTKTLNPSVNSHSHMTDLGVAALQ